jgi:acetylornithine deacetylase/succinyl-diaminopimelate desuccinylase-like protein
MGEIRDAARAREGDTVDFLQRLIRIPSFSGQEGPVVEAIAAEMKAVGFDEVRVDPFGNVRGRIGHGRRVLAFDAHVDTVEVGDRRLWSVDPFAAAGPRTRRRAWRRWFRRGR